ncbi:alpha/beta hydrolase [soil metagenome]
MFTEKTYNTGQVTINYAEGPTSGAPLLLLHGAILHWQDFQPLLPHLEASWHTYACDLRGHGKSSHVSSGYRAVDFIPDTTAFIQQVIGKPVVLLGHSNGGSIALGVAAQIPELIRAVVLLDPSLGLRDSSLQTLGLYELFLGVRDILLSVRSAEEVIPAFLPGIDEAGVQAVAEMIHQVDLVSVTVMLNNQFFDNFDLKQVMQKVTCPTLLLYGEIDKGSIVRERDVEFFQTTMPNGVAIQIKDASHSLHWDQSAHVLEQIRQFLGVV